MVELETVWRRLRLALIGLVALLAVAAPAALAQEAPTEPGHAPADAAHPPGDAAHPPAGEAGHGGAGMPQLDIASFPSQIVWLIAGFATLYYLMRRRALPRVTEILEARQERISGDLERAARLRDEAEEAERQYDALVGDARAKAVAELKAMQDEVAADAARRQDELRADLERQLAEAERRIGAARESALADVRGVAAEVARVAVHKLSGMELPPGEVEATLDRVRGEAA